MVEAQKHLSKEEKDAMTLKYMQQFMDEGTVTSLEDLTIKDCSGFSNNTLIVTNNKAVAGSAKPAKLVVRFFESAAADFAAETGTFRIMGEKDLGPKEYYVDEKIRVEQCIEGRALHMTEMRNPFVLKNLVESICDMNYDADLIAKSKEVKGEDSVFFRDFTGEMGWFTFAQGMRQAVNNHYVEDQDVKGIQQFLDSIMQNDADFKQQYAALQPKADRKDIDIVFSHNDFQENNCMVETSNYNKIFLIDFEYSQMNYRGADLAALFNEVMITYTHSGEIPFKVYYDWMLSSKEFDNMMKWYLTRFHEKHYKGDKDLATLLAEETPILKDQIQRCVLITHAMWAFGTLLLVPDATTKPMEFAGYHAYAWTRLEMLAHIKKEFFGEHLACLAIA
jgi:thiamine kinase-like enzyme